MVYPLISYFFINQFPYFYPYLILYNKYLSIYHLKIIALSYSFTILIQLQIVMGKVKTIKIIDATFKNPKTLSIFDSVLVWLIRKKLIKG